MGTGEKVKPKPFPEPPGLEEAAVEVGVPTPSTLDIGVDTMLLSEKEILFQAPARLLLFRLSNPQK